MLACTSSTHFRCFDRPLVNVCTKVILKNCHFVFGGVVLIQAFFSRKYAFLKVFQTFVELCYLSDSEKTFITISYKQVRGLCLRNLLSVGGRSLQRLFFQFFFHFLDGDDFFSNAHLSETNKLLKMLFLSLLQNNREQIFA